VFAGELDLSRPPTADDAPSLVSPAAGSIGEQELLAVRKVHHPKIVQRSDGRWIVACEDCRRKGESATPDGINSPVESLGAAERLWESHCERRLPPMRRTPGSS
jgi:hypothetical protein